MSERSTSPATFVIERSYEAPPALGDELRRQPAHA